jgi:hypothetical protein
MAKIETVLKQKDIISIQDIEFDNEPHLFVILKNYATYIAKKSSVKHLTTGLAGVFVFEGNLCLQSY